MPNFIWRKGEKNKGKEWESKMEENGILHVLRGRKRKKKTDRFRISSERSPVIMLD